jgi:hypothetical protein
MRAAGDVASMTSLLFDPCMLPVCLLLAPFLQAWVVMVMVMTSGRTKAASRQ